MLQVSEEDRTAAQEAADKGNRQAEGLLRALEATMKVGLEGQDNQAGSLLEQAGRIRMQDEAAVGSDAVLDPEEYIQVVYNILANMSSRNAALQDKFVVESRELKCGKFEHAAKGFYKLLNVEESDLVARATNGVHAIEAEVRALGDKSVSEQLDYILWHTASVRMFPNGQRDTCHAGKRLHDFVNDPTAKTAGLDEAEVVALRLYTTAAFRAINDPLRDDVRIDSGQPHPLPVTVMLINKGIKKLRGVQVEPDKMAGFEDSEDAGSNAALKPVVLWRGMRNIRPTDQFAENGGTEVLSVCVKRVFATVSPYIYTCIHVYTYILQSIVRR